MTYDIELPMYFMQSPACFEIPGSRSLGWRPNQLILLFSWATQLTMEVPLLGICEY